MTTAGWIFLSVAWASVIALTVFCLVKVLKVRPTPPQGDEADADQE